MFLTKVWQDSYTILVDIENGIAHFIFSFLNYKRECGFTFEFFTVLLWRCLCDRLAKWNNFCLLLLSYPALFLGTLGNAEPVPHSKCHHHIIFNKKFINITVYIMIKILPLLLESLSHAESMPDSKNDETSDDHQRHGDDRNDPTLQNWKDLFWNFRNHSRSASKERRSFILILKRRGLLDKMIAMIPLWRTERFVLNYRNHSASKELKSLVLILREASKTKKWLTNMFPNYRIRRKPTKIWLTSVVDSLNDDVEASWLKNLPHVVDGLPAHDVLPHRQVPHLRCHHQHCNHCNHHH